MSTNYNTSSKDTKDKDSTETYVSDTTNTKTNTTGGKGKITTTGTADTDRTHDTESTTQYGKNFSQYGTTSTQQPTRGQQYGQDSDIQGQRQQTEIQQKLKEVGNLLQRAGHLLQDLQCSSGEFQYSGPSSNSQAGRVYGGNYNGPYGGYESHNTSSYQPYGVSGPSQQMSNRYDSERAFQVGRFNEDRDQDRSYGFRSERGFGSRPDESRYESRVERSNTDRYGGFGGPNRPDLAYGEQYGPQMREARRGGDFEFSRRNYF